jgi:DNA-binding LacI/PurR family transcriptional regulator
MAGIRLQDVAELAGVSMKTVSNVVHDYEHVSVKTRQKVQRAIDELGYRPNMMGRRLATGKTGLIALAFAAVSIPYFAELSRVVSSAAARHGYRVLLEETDATLEGERAVVASSEAGMVDGVLFQPSVMSSTEIARHRSDLPMVTLGEGAAPLSIDRVMIDNVAAATDATMHLVRLGRTRIGFVGHEHSGLSATSAQRIMGYQQALESSGITPDPTLLVPSESISAAGAVAGVGAALDAGVRFDALVCRDDLAAVGALRALRERGLRIPEDVAITGWDNIEMSAVTFPSITTVAPDLEALAERAMTLLVERMGGYAGLGRHELVGYDLVVRESAPVPA